METSLKTGFAQIFSCCPKNLSRPKFWGAAAPLVPPARTPMSVSYRVTSIAWKRRTKKRKRNIMALFIESWGLRGSVSFFPLHLPLHSSFHGCALSPTFGQKLDRNVLLACILYSRRLLRSLFGPLHVSGKLSTYPSPKPTSTLTSHLGQKCWLRGGVGRNI